MELGGTYTLMSTREQVWKALFDCATLETCIPGCQQLDHMSDTEFNAIVKLKIGPVSAKFKGAVELSDVVPLISCTISGQGSGGIAGFAKGGAKIVLEETEGGTILTYTAEAKVGGKLAALGDRLIGAASRKLADEFFDNLSKALSSETESGAVAPAPTAG